MSFSSGVFTLVAGNPVVTGTTISSTVQNNTMNDVATGLSTCLLKDGTQTATATIPFTNITASGTITGPTIIGGSAVGSSLELRSTSGVGTTDFINFTVGNNGATEAARITHAGAFCVGATAPINSELMTVKKATNNIVLYLQNTSATNTTYMQKAEETGLVGSTGWLFYQGLDSAAAQINIFGNGNITNTNNSYGAISDAKLKDVIGLSDSQWSDVKALAATVKKYTLKSDPSKKVLLGLVAQDAQAISPGLVFSVPDYEGEGEERKQVGETLNLNYSVLYMKAVKALGEALVRIEALEAKVGI